MLMNEMNDDNTFKNDIVTVQMAQNTKIPDKVAFMINNKIYLGDREYYSPGIYDNSDNTLVFVSNNNNMFPFLVGRDYPDTAQDLIKRGELNLEDFKEYAQLKNDTLATFETVRSGDVSFNNKSFDEVYADIMSTQNKSTPPSNSPVDKMKAYRQEVTNKVIKMIETGTAPWQKPWDAQKAIMTRPKNINGRPYHGMNSLYLWYTSIERGYNDPRWLTFKQINELGARVKKGEKSVTVEYWQWTKKDIDKETGEEIIVALEKPRRFTANVFNAMQTTGLPELKIEPPKFSPHERAENIINAAGVKKVESINGRAYYSPKFDHIAIPPKNTFKTQDGYYSTILHEVAHSTGHASRLNRFVPGMTFGSPAYAKEELRAELASTFLCNELGITQHVDEQHAAYVGHWVKVLKEDHNEIFRASADADKICNYLYEKEKLLVKEQSTEQVLDAADKDRDKFMNYKAPFETLSCKDVYYGEVRKQLEKGKAISEIDNVKIAGKLFKKGFEEYEISKTILEHSPVRFKCGELDSIMRKGKRLNLNLGIGM